MTTVDPRDQAGMAALVLEQSLLLYAKHIREIPPAELLKAGEAMASLQHAIAAFVVSELSEARSQAAQAPATVTRLRSVPDAPA
jgi:hypothetical protein